MAFDINRYVQDFFNLPSPPLQERWVGEYEAVSVHVNGTVPIKLIETRRPYEDEDIALYRRQNYEPVTKGPFARFNSDLSRVFSGTQVSVNVNNDDLQDYLEGNNFDGMDLRSYWSRKLCKRMIVDPNGILVRWVNVVPDAPNAKVEPELVMVLSKNIKHFTKDVLSWEAEERSEIIVQTRDGSEVREEGMVYNIVDSVNYYKLRQYGRKEDASFELLVHYPHRLNRLPIDVLGGEEVVMTNTRTNKDEVWYQSFVANAMPYANECARQWSDHQGVLVTAGFPLREVEGIDCAYKGCHNGYITEKGLNEEILRKSCPSCKGRGKVAPFGPYGVLIRKKASMLEGQTGASDRDMVKFINPDPSILEFGNKTWRDYKADLEKELNQLFIDEAQSGVAKNIDREHKVAKLDTIGYHLYMVLMKHTIEDIAELMFFGVDDTDIQISLPPTFIVRSEEDLTSEMQSLKQAGAPFAMDGLVWMEFVRKRFPGQATLVKSVEVLAEYDVLFGMSDEDIVAQRAGGLIDDVLVRRHTLAPAALKRLTREYGADVLYQDNIFDLIDDKVEALLPAARLESPGDIESPGEEEGEEEDNTEMINGIVSMLRRIADTDNRMSSAEASLADFEAEGIVVNREEFIQRVMG
jgi:hypothetical protein